MLYKNMTVEEIANAIDVPVNEWVGNCHGIASMMVSKGLVEGKAVYGKFLGDSSKGFFKDTPVPNHGWILTNDGEIVDPTRWVFDDVDPYIYVTKSTDKFYDRGSNALKAMFRRPPPEFDEGDKSFDVDDNHTDFIMASLLQEKKKFNKISMSQVVWMCSLSLIELRESALPIYSWAIINGMKAFIPIDNYNEVMG